MANAYVKKNSNSFVKGYVDNTAHSAMTIHLKTFRFVRLEKS